MLDHTECQYPALQPILAEIVEEFKTFQSAEEIVFSFQIKMTFLKYDCRVVAIVYAFLLFNENI